MTGIFSAISSATNGLRAIQSDVRLVSDNVARSDDPTRTRHTVEKNTDASGSVVQLTFHRATNDSLSRQINQTIAKEGSAEARDKHLQALNDVLGMSQGQPFLIEAMENFSQAWRSLQTSPENQTAHSQVVDTAERFAIELRRSSYQIDQIEQDVKNEIKESVDAVNSKLQRIHELNTEIIALGKPDDVTLNLKDERDSIVRDLNQLIGVKTIEKSNGGFHVLTESGLSLVDIEPVKLSYDGATTVKLSAPEMNLQPHLREGKLGALLSLVKDGSHDIPAKPPSTDTYSEIFRKIRSQLDNIAQMFTDTTRDMGPTSFADAYDRAEPLESGELRTKFFTGNDRNTFEVNEALRDGTKSIKLSAIDEAASALSINGRDFIADGVSLVNVSYMDAVSTIFGLLGKATGMSSTDLEAATETRNVVETSFYNSVGVNLDEEIARLQTLQTSYQATARVMTVANSMYQALEGIVG